MDEIARDSLALTFWECGHIEVDRGREHPCPLDVCLGQPERYVPASQLRGEREEMRRLLSELVDPDPCWFDHHGACQAHDLQNPCPHEQAKKLLTEMAQRKSDGALGGRQDTDEGERTHEPHD